MECTLCKYDSPVTNLSLIPGGKLLLIDYKIKEAVLQKLYKCSKCGYTETIAIKLED